MRLKSGINQKRDIIYIVIAIALTIAVATYLFWLVEHLADKATDAFSADSLGAKIPTFDFDRYDRLMKNVTPSSSTLP